ncbi:MAG: DUF4387 domain-containing protein [Betaproteobacteria bacterium]|nr:DUF4387 domain-containing protein [Betaproteobacteria bacterium]
MQTLDQIAKVIRSKNAGPFCLTLDVLFDKPADYRRVRDAQVITREKMAALYRRPLDQVQVYNHESALAMKVSLVRWTPAGSLTDSDIYGAQQHVLLYKLPVP